MGLKKVAFEIWLQNSAVFYVLLLPTFAHTSFNFQLIRGSKCAFAVLFFGKML